jgi:hypothetical protein
VPRVDQPVRQYSPQSGRTDRQGSIFSRCPARILGEELPAELDLRSDWDSLAFRDLYDVEHPRRIERGAFQFDLDSVRGEGFDLKLPTGIAQDAILELAINELITIEYQRFGFKRHLLVPHDDDPPRLIDPDSIDVIIL